MLFVTGLSQLLKEVKWFLLFPTMTEFSKAKNKKKPFFNMSNKLFFGQVKSFKI